MMIASFLIALTLITLTGALAWIKKRKTPEDYLVASRGVKPWLTALSTVATNNSGFMFIGMIGYTFRFGVESFWLMFGWILGDLVTWGYVHPRVRRESEKLGANTLVEVLGTWPESASEQGEERGDPRPRRPVIIAAGLLTFLFLGVYAAAQLKAGSTALHALFGWDMHVGVLMGTAIVVLYSYAGGIRADVWTDAAQSFAMIATMVMIVVAGAMRLGGPVALLSELEGQDPSLVSIYPKDVEFGVLAFVAGYLFAGLGTVGQPHLMTRLMSVQSVQSVKQARVWYFFYYVPFFLASIAVGLYCRGILPDLASLPVAQEVRQPTELALPLLTMELLPEVFVGIALAGLFAATVSTAVSQVIVCSGTVTQEVVRRWKDSYLASKLATLSVTFLALLIAVFAPEGVFGLVLIAWSALGACLGPVLVLRLFRMPLSTASALAMMTAALVTVIGWHFSGYDDDVLKILPGTLSALVVYASWRLLRAGERSRSS